MYITRSYSNPLYFISWRRFVESGTVITEPGEVTASVIVIYTRKATARPSMPIAYMRRIDRYIASADPNSGQYSTQIPVWGQ